MYDYDAQCNNRSETGGIFANGAYTTAFQYLFNEVTAKDQSASKSEEKIICSDGCPVLLQSASGNILLAVGEVGSFLVIDTVAGLYHTFTYFAGGVGVGFPVGLVATAEVGSVSQTSIGKLSGAGLSVNAVAAAKTGATGQIFGSADTSDGTIGTTGGAVIGYAAGVSGLVTYSTYQGSYNYSQLPTQLKNKFGL